MTLEDNLKYTMNTEEIKKRLKNRVGNILKYLGTITSDYVANMKINRYRNKIIGFISDMLKSSDD